MRIKNFQDFTKSISIQESDGFGTMPYLEKRNGNVYYYFFKLDSEKKKEQKGYMLTIGKYSQHEDTPGAKNTYAVLNINQIGTEIIDDIAVDKKEIPNLNDTVFTVTENELSRLLEQCGKAIKSLDAKNYLEYLKSIMTFNLGSEWSAQEGSNPKVVILSR